MDTSKNETPETPASSEEMKLCLSCMFPNDPDVHFCAKCGAPMTSYAAIGPVEQLLAEGHGYRQAAERPRKFIVVLGVWIIFGGTAISGAELLFIGRDMGWQYVVVGGFFLPVSLMMIWKTTWGYFTRPRIDGDRDD
ncbi:MAG: hypothetical protein JWM68_628 [Verrucomicrobiales bacterium]|nr:hypothetical protein [Verrucomicrobiales bacterium]